MHIKRYVQSQSAGLNIANLHRRTGIFRYSGRRLCGKRRDPCLLHRHYASSLHRRYMRAARAFPSRLPFPSRQPLQW